MKKFLWLVLILAVLVVLYCGAIYLKNQFSRSADIIVPDDNLNPAEIKDKTITEQGDNYSIDIHYPETNHAFVNQDIQNFVQQQIIDFKQSIVSQTIPPDVNWQFSLFMNYKVVCNNFGLLSLKFETEQFLGGAHPIHPIFAKNYDLLHQRVMTFENIIKDQETLDKIATIALKRFQDLHLDYELFTEGLAAKKENYEIFNLVPGGIIFYFQEAQVLPYVAGPQELEIKYQEINQN